MVETIAISENITLADLRDKFNLQRTQNRQFFPEWFDSLPEITDLEKTTLDRLKDRYIYHIQDGPLAEEGIKMMIVSPLLEVAGFYDPPFKMRFENTVRIAVEGEADQIYRGRLDILVVQNQLWVMMIEGKRTSLSLEVGIPQALAYMLCNPNPDRPAFGLVTNGRNFIFLKLVKQEEPLYAQSEEFVLENEGDLYNVVRVMRGIAGSMT